MQWYTWLRSRASSAHVASIAALRDSILGAAVVEQPALAAAISSHGWKGATCSTCCRLVSSHTCGREESQEGGRPRSDHLALALAWL